MNQALRLAVAGLGLLGTTGLLSLAPRVALAEPNASEASPAFSPYTLSGVPASEQASEALETAGPGAKLRMYVPVQGDFNPDGTIAHALSNVIYVNDCRAGHNCTFRPGNDNSSTNTSGIPDFVGTLSAYKFGATQWAQTEACLREVFAPFGLQITTTDPGTTPHMELVVAGDPNQIMTNADGILGIAPFPAGSCSIIQQPIAFAFANAHDFYPSSSRPDEICATAAQEIAHTWALDHSVLANDPMTYKANNGNRRHFQDQEARCGSDGPVGGGTPSCTGSGLNCLRN